MLGIFVHFQAGQLANNPFYLQQVQLAESLDLKKNIISRVLVPIPQTREAMPQRTNAGPRKP